MNSTLRRCVYPLVSLAAVAALSAQSAPPVTSPSAPAKPVPAPAEVEKQPEPVQLNPFEVESARDYGYLATNSVSATGSGAAVRDTPMSIMIMTEEYIRDKNLNDLQDVIRNVSSITAEGKEENVVTSRGFQSVMKQDGAEIDGLYGTYNVGRVEVIKGAVSVLQGRGSAGGVINVISRKPRFTRDTQLRTTYGSYDYSLAQFSHTGPFADGKSAYLIGYTRMNRGDGWVDWTHRTDESFQAALTFRPFKKVSLTLDYQSLDRDENNGQHISFTHPAFLASDLEAISRYDNLGLARPALYPRLGETTRSWLDRTPGFGNLVPAETIDVMEVMYPSGYRANIQGPEQFRHNDNKTYSAELLLNIAPWLDWKSTATYRDRITDSINWSTFRIAGGLSINSRFTRGNFTGYTWSTRHEGVSRFSLLGMRHRMLGGFEYQAGKSHSRTLNGPVATRYNPRTDPLKFLEREINAFSPNGFPALNLTNASTPVRSFYLLEQAEAWENRINILAGGRFSSQRRLTVEADRFTPQFGAVLRIPHYEAVSLYASYGESYRPNFNRDGLGNPIPPIEEVNREAGVKVELFGGKVSGSASVYRLEQKNVSLRDYAREAATGINGLYILSGLARSEGWETDMVISPWRNYQVVLAYSEIWSAKTVRAEDVRQQGVRMQGAPDSQFSIWNKYTFLRGPLARAYVGVGMRYTGVMRIHPSWESPIDAASSWYGDVTVGYPLKVKRTQVELVLNVKNVFDEFYYNQTFRPADPRLFFFSANVKF
ncbi:MAG: TonB-dependent receptor [Verrucomicrobiota bacterium]